jgi:hypothetical protein
MTNVNRPQIAFFAYITAGMFGLLALFALTSPDGTGVTEGYVNAGLGILFVIAGQLLARGKFLAVILIGLAILGSMVYTFWASQGVNFVMIIFGAVWAIWLNALRVKGELNG